MVRETLGFIIFNMEIGMPADRVSQIGNQTRYRLGAVLPSQFGRHLRNWNISLFR